jgi:hypothetical protein
MLVFQAGEHAVSLLFFRLDGQGFMYLRACIAARPEETVFTKWIGMSSAMATPLINCMMSAFCGGVPAKEEPDSDRMSKFFRTVNDVVQGDKGVEDIPDDLSEEEVLQAAHTLAHASQGLQLIYDEVKPKGRAVSVDEAQKEVLKRVEGIALKMKLN